MVRIGKWVEGSQPNQPVSQLAKQALAARLEMVASYLPMAAQKADEDTEYVHQLRVATRRAVAAIQAFGDLLPVKRTKKMNKHLRDIRRAAGDARNLDVLVDQLLKQRQIDSDSRRDQLVHWIRHCRQRAQGPLKKIAEPERCQWLAHSIEALLKRIRWRECQPELTLAMAGPRVLRPAVADFVQATEADLGDVIALHRMRIAAKRLRYAMELLAGGFPPWFRAELYPSFSEIQDRLGEINDACMAKSMFSNWIGGGHPPQMIDEFQCQMYAERQRIVTGSRAFRDWWTAARSEGLRVRFETALKGPDGNEDTADTTSREIELG